MPTARRQDASAATLSLSEPPAALVLTPGASADRDHATLVAIDDAIDELTVERVTLGTTSIAKAVRLVVEAVERVAEQIGVDPSRIALGGRSFGGRACSIAVAEGLDAAGLVLLSYPLHPPGKPENLRVEHFPRVTAPSLFVSGEKDPFGTADEFATHLPSLGGAVAFEPVRGNHAPKGVDSEIIALIRSFLALESAPTRSGPGR